MIEKDFVTEGLKRTRIDEYLESELERAGYGGMEIQVTPLGTMVVVYAERPGMVIGRGGKTVRSITQNLKTGYGLENPQVEVKEVDNTRAQPEDNGTQNSSHAPEGNALQKSCIHSTTQNHGRRSPGCRSNHLR